MPGRYRQPRVGVSTHARGQVHVPKHPRAYKIKIRGVASDLVRAEFDDVELWEAPGATWLRTGGADTAAGCTWHATRRAAGMDGCALAALTVTIWPGKQPLMRWRRSPRSAAASAARACSGPGHPSSRCLACRRRLTAASGRPGHCPWIRKTGTGSPAASSHPSAQNGTSLLLPALRRAVAEGLSGEQRTVFTAVTLHGVPTTALAAAPGSNRNAIYKALFEARRILRARLAANRRDLAYLPGAPWTGPPGWMICSALTRGIRGAI